MNTQVLTAFLGAAALVIVALITGFFSLQVKIRDASLHLKTLEATTKKNEDDQHNEYIRQLKSDKEELRKELADNKSEIRTLRSEMETMRSEMRKLRDALEAHQDGREQAELERDAAITDAGVLRSELQTCEKDRDFYNGLLSALILMDEAAKGAKIDPAQLELSNQTVQIAMEIQRKQQEEAARPRNR